MWEDLAVLRHAGENLAVEGTLSPRVLSPPTGSPLAPELGFRPGLRQHVHQDLVGAYRFHQEGGQERPTEGEGLRPRRLSGCIW